MTTAVRSNAGAYPKPRRTRPRSKHDELFPRTTKGNLGQKERQPQAGNYGWTSGRSESLHSPNTGPRRTLRKRGSCDSRKDGAIVPSGNAMTDQQHLPLSMPRSRARRVMMRVVDAGDEVIQFRCSRCGHDTGWIMDTKTVTENRRGMPCPKCNEAQP